MSNPISGLGKSITGFVDKAVDDVSKTVDSTMQKASTDAQKALGYTGQSRFDGDVKSAADLIQSGVNQVQAGVDTSMGPLGPPPTLSKPVVMITGLTMQASSYDPMAQHLASNPKNGPVAVYVVADGKFHQGSVTGPVMNPQQAQSAKIFEVQYIDPKAAPTEKAPQIAQAMKAIQGATGQSNVDVVCHSAGCTDFRLYLQQRTGADASMGIDHTVFIGPASHGTEMGNVGDAVGAPLGLKQAGGELAVGSSLVDNLNQNWSNQLGQMKGGLTIVGLKGAPTASPEGLVDGDGYMPADSVGMPGAKTVMLQGVNPTPLMHLWEVHYSGVINTVDQALSS